jgi:hypothetical protein
VELAFRYIPNRELIITVDFGRSSPNENGSTVSSAFPRLGFRWQRRLNSNSSEDETLLLEPGQGTDTFSGSILRRATNQPAIQSRSAYVKWKEILVMPAQRFGERQRHNTTSLMKNLQNFTLQYRVRGVSDG